MVSDKASSRAALAGIVLMLAGIFLFAVNDALGKWLVATYSVGHVQLIRSLAPMVLLAPFIWRDAATFAAAGVLDISVANTFGLTARVGKGAIPGGSHLLGVFEKRARSITIVPRLPG